MVIVGMDLAKGQETVTVSAIFNEGSLKGRFNPRNAREIDVPAQWHPRLRFEVEVFDLALGQQRDTGLFRVARIDEHLFGHGMGLRGGASSRR